MFDNIPIQKRLKIILGLIGFVFVVSLFYGKQVWDIYAKADELEVKTALVADADLEIVNRQVRLKALGEEIRQVQQLDIPAQTGSHQVQGRIFLDQDFNGTVSTGGHNPWCLPGQSHCPSPRRAGCSPQDSQ